MTASPSIMLQLYSVRAHAAEDVGSTLAAVREAGFESIELYNLVSWQHELAAAMKATGIQAPSAHARLTEGGQEQIFAVAAELGVKTIIDPHIAPERWTTASSVERIADELQEIAETARAYGLQLAYHNHFWEIESVVEGQIALEYLAERLPAEVGLEVDAYWAAIAGADVAAMLRRIGNSVRFLHVKDAPATADGALSKDRMDQVPVGEGALDWDSIISAAPAAEYIVVEFDEYRGDVFDAASRSRQTLIERGFVS